MKITVKIQPNAKTNAVVGWEGNTLKLRIAAPPVEGKANDALIAFLAKLTGTPKSSITLLKGESSKIKILDLPDSTIQELNKLM